jgi:hypothetical protein
MTREEFLRIRPAVARAIGIPARDVSVCLTYRAGELVEAVAYWLRPGRGWTRATLAEVLPAWAEGQAEGARAETDG